MTISILIMMNILLLLENPIRSRKKVALVKLLNIQQVTSSNFFIHFFNVLNHHDDRL